MVSNLYPRLLSTAFALAALTTQISAAHAGPAISYATDTVEYSQQTCMGRARNALTQDGWQGIHGNDRSTVADRGPLSVVVICLEETYTQSIGMIAVAGGENGVASAAEDRLQKMIFGD